MCRKVTCTECRKATWVGCGEHIEQALAGVPQSERCSCNGGVPAPAAAPTGNPVGQG